MKTLDVVVVIIVFSLLFLLVGYILGMTKGVNSYTDIIISDCIKDKEVLLTNNYKMSCNIQKPIIVFEEVSN